jgi:hypothetical protein
LRQNRAARNGMATGRAEPWKSNPTSYPPPSDKQIDWIFCRVSLEANARCQAYRNPGLSYRTPSFFCRLEDEVVYWNRSFLSGKR